MSTASPRIGLLGATGIGIGAIVGGGILALAGTAIEETGPGAILAFAGNGLIAFLTAATFAELAARFPESGGTYTFARKVLTVEAAFVVGWVVWFASIVAAVLYALGFGAFVGEVIVAGGAAFGREMPGWVEGRPGEVLGALIGIAFYATLLARRGGSGGMVSNVAKVAVFAVLIVAGAIWCLGLEGGEVRARVTPMLPEGVLGLATAMGFTFIALQGFDLIAAASGEVRDARRTVPRAMFLSLGLANVIYLPLLFVALMALGAEPGGARAVAAAEPETVIAVAAQRFLGPTGMWLVLVAGVFAMASALQANLFAASRIAAAMARDRTLPARFERTHATRGTPGFALLVTACLVAGLAAALPDVAAAGAASSLIFLVTFALAHGIAYLARRRTGSIPDVFRTPLFPLVPVLGGAACLGLALFQGVAVPSAGLISAAWIAAGGFLFLGLLGNRARARDAASEASDPDLVRLRGRAPLVLAPIANPQHAESLLSFAGALAPPRQGRVLLLSVVRRPPESDAEEIERRIEVAQSLVRRVLTAAIASGVRHETMLTIAEDQWGEIARVVRVHRCAVLVVGLGAITDAINEGPLVDLLSRVDCDCVILRALPGWSAASAQRILVPLAGRGVHDVLRARLVAGLVRGGAEEVTYLRVIPPDAPPDRERRLAPLLHTIARDEAGGRGRVEIVRAASPVEELAARAESSDLVVLGLASVVRKRRLFGSIALDLAQRTDTAIALVGGDR